MTEYKTSTVICLHCLRRWVSVRPVETLLVDIECPECGLPGAVIETGEEIQEKYFKEPENTFIC